MFQILVFAIIWTWGCKQLRKENNTLKNKVFQYIVTLIICILPLNFMYSITLWKDILYSYAFLAILICIFNFIRNDFKLTIKDIILLTLSLVCVTRFRHNGFIIGFVMFGLVLIINFIKQRKIKISSIFIISFIVIYLIGGIPEKLLFKEEVQENEVTSGKSIYRFVNGTILHAMGAILNSNIEIEQEDLEFLNNILDIEIWKESYSPYTAAGIHYNKKLNGKAYASKEDNDKFGDMFIKYAKREPIVILKHFIELNSIDWSIKEHASLHSVVLENSWISEMSGGKYDNHPKLPKTHEFLYKYVLFTLNNSKIYMLIYRPATAMYISTILILIISIKKKTFKYILTILPMFLNIAPYIILITSQDQRYFYPSFITCYFTILLFGTIFFNKKYVKTEEKTKNNEIKKILTIINNNNSEELKKDFIEKIQKENINSDILIINNGFADDNRYEILKTDVKIINLPNKLTYESGVQSGYMYAYENDYDAVVEIMKDYNPKYIKQMIEILNKENIDIVIGSRFIQKNKYKQNIISKIKTKLISFMMKFYTEEKIYDIASKYKVVNKQTIKKLATDIPYNYTEFKITKQMLLENKKIKEISIVD